MKQKLTKQQAQEVVWEFIYDFRDEVAKEMGKQIDFVIIYGSAVRQEFVPGKSDVDILIQIFKEEDRKVIEKRATEIFWKISKRYPLLEFENSLSVTKTKKRNPINDILKKLEKSSFLYVPVFVFVKGEIDWEYGELHSDNPLIKIGQSLLIPQRSVFLRFKEEGIVLYGRDVRKEIQIKLTAIDRLRLGVAPQLLSLVGFLVSFISRKKGIGYSVKALLYQVDALLTAVASYQKMERSEKIAKNQKVLLEEFTHRLGQVLRLKLDYTKGNLRPSDFILFEEAIVLKWGEKNLSYLQTIWFCLKANWFIVRSNGRAIAYLILRKLHFK